MNQYLIPANSKRGKLFLGFFRPVDLVILVIGVSITLLSLLLVQQISSKTWLALVGLIPSFIAILLVLPLPHHHNVLILLTEIYNYYFVNRQQYVWKGWCSRYGESEK